MTVNAISNDTIQDVFQGEIQQLGGENLRVYSDERFLVIRALLPQIGEVAKNDAMQNGVALCATQSDINVMPFMQRQVCRNGAVLSHSLEATRLDRLETDEAWTTFALGRAARACGREELFANNLNRVAQTRFRPIDKALNILGYLGENSKGLSSSIRRQVMRRLLEHEDQTEYGIMNAVTWVAKEVRSEHTTWALQTLGGKIGLNYAKLPERKPMGEHRVVKTLLERAGAGR